jgi:hypothetical protein
MLTALAVPFYLKVLNTTVSNCWWPLNFYFYFCPQLKSCIPNCLVNISLPTTNPSGNLMLSAFKMFPWFQLLSPLPRIPFGSESFSSQFWTVTALNLVLCFFPHLTSGSALKTASSVVGFPFKLSYVTLPLCSNASNGSLHTQNQSLPDPSGSVFSVFFSCSQYSWNSHLLAPPASQHLPMLCENPPSHLPQSVLHDHILCCILLYDWKQM